MIAVAQTYRLPDKVLSSIGKQISL